jgi:hypothetical protein
LQCYIYCLDEFIAEDLEYNLSAISEIIGKLKKK